jgi:calcium-dependent protein kinase
MAPQILQKRQYGAKCDVWSLGVIFYEMLFGQTMWQGVDEKDLLRNIMYKALQMKKNRYSYFNLRNISQSTEDLLRKMLVFEEKDRISCEDLI